MKSCFLNLKAKSECFFMFKFHNNRIYFSVLIKFVSTLIKFALCPSYLLYIRISLLHSKNLFFALNKTVHCFLIKIVHCFLHKLFLAFCIKLFSTQHYLQNCSLSFLRKLFYVHYLKNCSLFSRKTHSEIAFSKSKRQIWMLFHVRISQQSNLFFCIDKIYFYINKICTLLIMFTVYSNLLTAFKKSIFCIK